mmetsp:Transcript_15982/g.39280  ORF Transcript_15982/g.39280 Transcript_15982/m.39280 type:complete len:125 (-) Transcript_15982:433-807(-)
MRGRGMEEGPALHFAASFLSGVVAQTVTQPADTLKTLVMTGGDGGASSVGGVTSDGGGLMKQVAGKRNSGGGGTMDVLRRLLARSGPAGLYRGYWPAMARQGPVMVIQMPIVEQFRKMMGLEYF